MGPSTAFEIAIAGPGGKARKSHDQRVFQAANVEMGCFIPAWSSELERQGAAGTAASG